MSIKRINEFPSGSGTLTGDDIFLIMDDPNNTGSTKHVSLNDIVAIIGSGGGGGEGTTISNSGNDRLLTSDGTSTGINGEANLTFDGSVLNVSGNITANSGILDILGFDTNIEPNLIRGQMAWNDTEGTVNVAITDNTDIHIGEHSFFRLRNETGSILYKGQAVYSSGVHSNGIIVPNLYAANGTIREIRFLGLVLENINHNNNGYAIQFGHIENIDTRGNVSSNIAVGDETWADGDILYVHPTVAGKLTKNEPKHGISAAIILEAASNGRIFVRPISYGHLDDNHDVNVSGVTDGQFLQYNSSTDYWVPSSSGNFSTLQVNGTGVSVSGHSHPPIVVQLGSVSGTINTNSSLGDIFDLTLMSSGTLANPTNSVDGKTLRWRITYDSNNIPLTFGSEFRIPNSATTPLPISTSSGLTDLLGATYDSSRNKWDIIAFVPGY